jgi:hypothetical protein
MNLLRPLANQHSIFADLWVDVGAMDTHPLTMLGISIATASFKQIAGHGA